MSRRQHIPTAGLIAMAWVGALFIVAFFGGLFVLPAIEQDRAASRYSLRIGGEVIEPTALRAAGQSGRSNRSSGPVWVATASCRYTVNAREYETRRRRVQLVPEFRREAEAREAAAKLWPAASPVTIYINPSDPADAILDNGPADWSRARVPLIACIASLAGALAVTGSPLWRTKRRRASRHSPVAQP